VTAPEPTKRCPYCAEEILAAAVKCKHCGSALPRPSVPSVATGPNSASPVLVALGICAVIGTVVLGIWCGVAGERRVAMPLSESAFLMANPSPPPADAVPPPPFDPAACKRKRASDIAETKAVVAELRKIERAASTVDRQDSDCFENSLRHMRAVDTVKARAELLQGTVLWYPLAGAVGNMRACSLSCGAHALKEWAGNKCKLAVGDLSEIDRRLPEELADNQACEDH